MKKLILICCLVYSFSFGILANNELKGKEPLDGKAYEEVTIIMRKNATIPKTYFFESHDFSGTLYYKMHYISHHNPEMIYVLYEGWVYLKRLVTNNYFSLK